MGTAMGSHEILTDEELAFIAAYTQKRASQTAKRPKKRPPKQKPKPVPDEPTRTVYAVRHTKWREYQLSGSEAHKFGELTSVQDAQDAVKKASLRVAQWKTQRRGECREILREVTVSENDSSPRKFQPLITKEGKRAIGARPKGDGTLRESPKEDAQDGTVFEARRRPVQE